MRYTLATTVFIIGLALTGCGQQAVAPPTAVPATTVPATTVPATAVPPTVAASPTAAPATTTVTAAPSPAQATGTPTSAPLVSPTGSSATPPSGRVTDTPAAEVPAASPAAANQQQIADLAQRGLAALPEVGPRTFSVQSIEEQEWSDGSLGCPDPAAIYLAVITPGYKIMLNDGATTYAVHTNSDGSTMVWCKDNRPVTLVAAS